MLGVPSERSLAIICNICMDAMNWFEEIYVQIVMEVQMCNTIYISALVSLEF